MSIEANKAVLLRAIESFSPGGLESYLEWYHPTAEAPLPASGPTPQGEIGGNMGCGGSRPSKEVLAFRMQ